MIKSSPEAKDNVLNFLSTVIKHNLKRGMIQVNRNEVSSDGFMFNILQLCKKLSDPIVDQMFSKISLIDTAYFLRYSRLDFSDETRIKVDNEKLKEIIQSMKKEDAQTIPNFVTEIFVITLAMHHYGLLSTIRYYKDFEKEIEEMQKVVFFYIN